MTIIMGTETKAEGPRCKHHDLPVAYQGDTCYRCKVGVANTPDSHLGTRWRGTRDLLGRLVFVILCVAGAIIIAAIAHILLPHGGFSKSLPQHATPGAKGE